MQHVASNAICCFDLLTASSAVQSSVWQSEPVVTSRISSSEPITLEKSASSAVIFRGWLCGSRRGNWPSRQVAD